MSSCDQCGKKQGFYYICSHCKGRFCKEHRLPGTHSSISTIEEITLIPEVGQTIPDEIKVEVPLLQRLYPLILYIHENAPKHRRYNHYHNQIYP